MGQEVFDNCLEQVHVQSSYIFRHVAKCHSARNKRALCLIRECKGLRLPRGEDLGMRTVSRLGGNAVVHEHNSRDMRPVTDEPKATRLAQ